MSANQAVAEKRERYFRIGTIVWLKDKQQYVNLIGHEGRNIFKWRGLDHFSSVYGTAPRHLLQHFDERQREVRHGK